MKTKKNIQKNFDNMKDAILTEHTDLFNISTKLDYFANAVANNFEDTNVIIKDVTKGMDNIESEQQRIEKVLILIIEVLKETSKAIIHKEMYTHCSAHKILIALIPTRELKRDLIELNKKIKKRNLTLAIPVEQILRYYTLELTDCQFASASIFVEVRIPVKKIQAEWKLYNYIPIFFKHNNELCIINSKQMLIAYDKGNDIFKTISGAQKNCDLNSGLCYVDYFEY